MIKAIKIINIVLCVIGFVCTFIYSGMTIEGAQTFEVTSAIGGKSAWSFYSTLGVTVFYFLLTASSIVMLVQHERKARLQLILCLLCSIFALLLRGNVFLFTDKLSIWDRLLGGGPSIAVCILIWIQFILLLISEVNKIAKRKKI